MLSKLLLVLLLATFGLKAQSIEILNVITDNYPEIKAEIRAVDGNGNEFRNFGAINPPELTLRENGQVVPIKTAQCEANLKRFSLIISLDVSGSMAAQQTPQGISRAQLAKNVLVNLANNFPWERGELAIYIWSAQSSMPKLPDIHQGFTRVKEEFIKSVGTIPFVGGTNFNHAFLGDPSRSIRGPLDIADQDARFSPFILFITDGEHEVRWGAFDVAGVNARAPQVKNGVGCKIFAFSVGTTLNPDLNAVATSNGGSVKSNLNTEGQINSFLDEILTLAQQVGELAPCEITWDSNCDGGDLNLTFNQGSNPSGTFEYTVPDNLKPALEYTPNRIVVENLKPGEVKDIPFRVCSKNNFTDLTNIAFNFGPNAQIVGNTGGRLNKDQCRDLTLRVTGPDDSVLVNGTFDFNSTACSGRTMPLSLEYLYTRLVDCGGGTIGDPVNVTRQAFCNNTNNAITITNIRINGGANPADFGVVNQTNLTIAAGECRTFNFRFTPTAIGQRSAIFTVTVQGKGDFDGIVQGVGGGMPFLEVADDVDLGTVSCLNTERKFFLELKNTGPSRLTITSMNIDNPANFQVRNLPTEIEANSSVLVEIDLTYTGTYGPLQAILTYESNAENTPVKNITLRGLSLENLIQPQVTTIDFGVVCANNQYDRVLQVNNAGTLPEIAFTYTLNNNEVTIPGGSGSVSTTASRNINVRLEPVTEGDFSAILTLIDECDRRVEVNIIAVVESPELVSPLQNFTANVGAFEEKDITVTNNTSHNITIANAVVAPAEFTVVNFPTNNIFPGGNALVRVRYTPNVANVSPVNGTLTLSGNLPCDYSSDITINGNPNLATASLQAVDASGLAGQQVPITFRLFEKAGGYQNSNIQSWKAQLTYDDRILEAVGYAGTVVGNNRTIEIEFNANTTLAEELNTIQFRVKNEAAELPATGLILSNIIATPQSVAITPVQGVFTPEPAIAVIELPDAEASPGQVFKYRVVVKDNDEVLQNFHQGVTTELRYNSTLLEAIGRPTRVEGDQRVLTLTRNVDFAAEKGNNSTQATDYLLDEIDFKAMLGNAEQTDMVVTNSEVLTGRVTFQSNVGKFTLTGICRDESGAIRLFNPDGVPNSLSIPTPNPATEKVLINYSLVEPGFVTLSVVDMAGRVVKVLLGDYQQGGTYQAEYDISQITNGNYQLILNTPSERLSSTLRIAK